VHLALFRKQEIERLFCHNMNRFKKEKCILFVQNAGIRDLKRRKAQASGAHFPGIPLKKAEDRLDSSFRSVI
jgi:hypothetical protein